MSWAFLRIVNGFLFGWFGGGAILRGNYLLGAMHFFLFIIGLLILYKLEAMSKEPPAR